MLITRKLGKIIRGKATPFQLMAACVLGSMIAFVPGLKQAPGMLVFLILLLLVVNANLGVAALTGIVAKLVSLAAMPLSYEVGRVLIDGPTQGLFKGMINAPVLALFGFDNYVATGGVMVVGLVFGALVGALLIILLKNFRLKMAKIEEGSERYKKFSSKKWVKILAWILIGPGHGKKTYAELASKKVGNPIRIIGVVAVALFLGLAFVARLFLAEPIVTAALQAGLERANGATVDLQRADLDLSEGRLVVTGLAMADPNALDKDVFKAATVEANISGADLLRKRLVLDRVVAKDAASGTPRRVPGRIVGPKRDLPKDSPPKEGDEKTLEDYVEQAQVWRERLAQARDWLERSSEPTTDDTAPDDETLRERLRRQVRELGYANVRATHLIDETPTLLAREVLVEGLNVEAVEKETLNVRATSISTQPWLVDEKPRIEVTSESDRIALDTVLGPAGLLTMHVRQMSADALGAAMAFGGEPPLKGGFVNVNVNGTWGAEGVGHVNLPMTVVVRDSTIQLEGLGSAPVERLAFPVGVRGTIDDPRISVDSEAFAKALADAGAAQLASRVRAEAQGQIDKVREEAEEKLKEEVGDKAKDALKDILGGGG